MRFLSIFGLVLLFCAGLGLDLYLDLGKVPTNWDDFDYGDYVKRDFNNFLNYGK